MLPTRVVSASSPPCSESLAPCASCVTSCIALTSSYSFTSWLADLFLYSASTSPMCLSTSLTSCSPHRNFAVPAPSASTLSSYSTWSLLVSYVVFLSLCSRTADHWPISRCLCLPFSPHYSSVCYLFRILVDSFHPCSFLFP